MQKYKKYYLLCMNLFIIFSLYALRDPFTCQLKKQAVIKQAPKKQKAEVKAAMHQPPPWTVEHVYDDAMVVKDDKGNIREIRFPSDSVILSED